MKRKLTKSLIAMFVLVAMLAQNGLSVYAAATSPEPIQVENEFIDEQSDEPSIEVVTEETSDDENYEEGGTEVEYVDGDVDDSGEEPSSDENYDDEIMLISEDEEFVEEVADEAEEEEEAEEEQVPEEIEILDTQISGSGLDELEIYVDTEELEVGDTFRLIFTGAETANYDSRINDNLDTTSQGTYRFTDLNKEGFNIRAKSDDNVRFEFTSEGGTPVIKAISVESNGDKVLFTKTVTDRNGKDVVAIDGEGFKNITIKLDTEELDEEAEFTVFVDTEADVKINDESTDNILGTKSLENIELSGLNKKKFIVYISGNEGFDIESDASIKSVEDGEATIFVSGGEERVKREYKYSDADVEVIATLEDPKALPDDAYFYVERVEDTQEYLDVMNVGDEEEEYTDENTLIYDITFYTDDTKSEEIEPEEGSVTVSIRFKKNQINEELSTEATEVEDVEVIHLEEKGNSIEAVTLESNSSSDNKEIEFTTDSFSKYAIHADGKITMEPGAQMSISDALGDAYYYGLVANEMTINGHLESNFATGFLHGGAGVQAPKNDNGGAGYTYIGDYDGSYFQMTSNGNAGNLVIYTTEDAAKKFNSDMGITRIDTTKSKSEIQGLVSKMVSDTVTKSESIASEANSNGYKFKDIATKDGNNFWTVDIANGGTNSEGTYYIDFEPGEYGAASGWNQEKGAPETGTWAGDSKGLTIKLKSGQIVVLNIPDTSVNISSFQVEIDGTTYKMDGYQTKLTEHVIFNCPNATTAHTNLADGVFLFPKADYSIGLTSAGWLVANKILNIGGQEWHCLSKNIPVIEDDKTELDLIVTKFLRDEAGNEVEASKWPEDGFKFTIKKYPCNDPGDANDANVEHDEKYIPDIVGTNEIAIKADTPGHQASFGKLSFTGADVYNYERSHKSYNFGSRDVRYLSFMYKIEEVDTGAKNIVYDNKEPLYVKIFVNSEKVKISDNSYKYYVWTEVKTARTVRVYECLPKLPEFTNTYVGNKEVVLHGKKTINGDANIAVPDQKFNFKLTRFTYDSGKGKFDRVIETVSNDGNEFAFSPIELDFNDTIFYHDADYRLLKEESGDGFIDQRRANATFANFYYLIEEESCDPYQINDKYMARVTLERIWGTNAYGKKIVKGYAEPVVHYFHLNKDDWADVTQAVNGGATTMTFNNTYKAVGFLRFNAFKQMSNANLDDYNGKFSFKISTENDPYFKDSRRGLGNEVVTNHADSTGHDAKYVTFDTLEYDQSDIANSPYIYHINEVIPENKLPGVTYDETDYKIVVNLSDNGDGSIKAAAKVYRNNETTPCYEYENSKIRNAGETFTNKNAASEQLDSQRPVFTNVYESNGEVVLSATKKYTGAIPEGESFDFILEKGTESETKTITAPAKDIEFSAIKYTSADIKNSPFTYYISEKHPTEAVQQKDGSWFCNGIKYDGKKYTVVVSLTDNGDGTIGITKTVTADGKSAENIEFTNDYSTEDITTDIVGTKTLHGKKLSAGEFNFEISVSDTENCEIKETSVPNDENGEFKFEKITFKKAGTYTFTIRETKGTDEKVTYSNDEYKVDVVIDDDHEGHLVVTSKSISKNGATATAIGFTNIYDAEGKVTLTANKKLEGRALEANQFTFEILDENEKSLGEDYVKKNNADGTITFKPIEYKLSQMADGKGGYHKDRYFVYYIVESIPDNKAKGYTYDESKQKVTVKVTLNDDGTLSTNADYEGGKAEFVNTYKAEGYVEFGGSKKITGRKFKTEDNGLFKAELYENGTIIDSADITKSTAIFGENGGVFNFSKISYTQEDLKVDDIYKRSVVKQYTVKESGSATKVTNDTTIYTVDVTLVDNGDGTITATPSYKIGTNSASGIVFNNIYDADGKAFITAHKVLDFGSLTKNQFEFELYDASDTKIDAATNDEAGLIRFTKGIEYKLKDLGDAEDKDFTYTIKEVNTGKKGYKYSGAVFTAVVNVKNVGGENLTTAVTYKDADGKTIDAAAVIFENKYEANGEVELSVKKTLNGRAMTDGQFEFGLYDENGDLIQKVPSVASANGVASEIKFNKLTFKQTDLKEPVSHLVGDGTYAKYYTVKEIVPSEIPTGYTYDEKVYNVVVTLKDNGEGGITTDWYAYESGKTPEKPSLWDKVIEFVTGKSATKNIAFTNYYTAEGKLVLSAHKTVNGATLESNDFSFNLSGKAEDGSNINETVSNDDKGNVAFSEITFTKPTEAGKPYEYTVKEVIPNPKKAGYTYDETPRVIKVTVTDDGSGVLKVTTDSPAAESKIETKADGTQYGLCTPAAIEFVNSYTAKDTSITVGGTKTLTGKDLTDGEFSFTMVSADGNAKTYNETVQNNENGKFTFPTITYTFDDMKNADGTYALSKNFAYTVNEVIGKEDGVTYNNVTYNVVVEVKNANGELSAKLKVNDVEKADPSNAVSYTNNYDAENSVSFTVQKAVTGTDDDTKTFKFTISGDANEERTGVKANGQATFGSYTYKISDFTDADKQADGSYKKVYTYTISESQEDKHAGYTYSDEVYTAVVTVTTNGNGVLNVDKQVTNKAGDSVDGALVFTNKYAAEGEVLIEGLKSLVASTATLAQGDYRFVLTDEDGTEITVSNGKVIDVTKAGTTIADAATVGEFGIKLHYDQTELGEHTYTLKEVIPSPKQKAIVYDENVYTVVVNVSDAGDGTLSCGKTITKSSQGFDKASFANYIVDDNSVQFTAKKSLTGRVLTDGMFTFTLADEKGNVLQTKTNKGENVNFEAIKYTLEDLGDATQKQYTYVITESAGTINGMSYSTEQYKAVVTLKLENGVLNVSKEIKNNAGSTVNSATDDGMLFENSYESDTKVQFSGKKNLVGFEKNDDANKGKYTFALLDKSGKEIDRKTVIGAKDFSFDEITFDQDDYANFENHQTTYTVKEVVVNEDKLDSVKYSNAEYHITVKLQYANDGSLEAVVSTDENVDALKNGLAFTNVPKGKTVIDGTKTVSGMNLSTGDYEFELIQVNNGAETSLEKVKNVGNTFTFEPIQYTEAGTYTYKVKEVAGDNKAVTYDDTIYTVVVEVTSNTDGTLSVTKSVKVGEIGKEVINFNNTYKANGSLELAGTKILENKKLEADKFSFVLKDATGTPLETVKNKADGSFEFDKKWFTYTQEDLKVGNGYVKSVSKYYTVEEVQTDVSGITNSTAVYAVEMKLTDDGEGHIDVKKSVKLTNASAKTGFAGLLDTIKSSIGGSNDEIKFVNTYNAEGKWDPEGYKELVGRNLKDDEFTFKIAEVDDKGNTKDGHEATVKNKGNQIKFSSDDISFLHYTIKDLEGYGPEGRTYIYKFSEVKQSAENGVKYDDTVFRILVQVSDKGDGTLNVDVNKESILPNLTQKIKDANIADKVNENVVFAFYNEYAASGSIDLLGTKNFEGPDALAAGFNFSIKETTPGRESAEIVVPNDNGVVRFTSDSLDMLKYEYISSKNIDDRGIHTYEIKEVIPADANKAPGVKYDERVYTVTVNVTEETDANGELTGKLKAVVESSTYPIIGNGTDSYPIFIGSDQNRANYFEFNNKYEAKADVLFKGVKNLKLYEDSEDRITGDKLTNAGFEFAIYKIDGKTDPLVAKATPDANGNFVLGIKDDGSRAIAFTQDDISESPIHYQIKEVVKTGDGIVYDTTVYDVYVTVSEPNPGSDKLNITIKDKDGNVITPSAEDGAYTYTASGFNFTNYKPEYVEISGEKHWVGGPADGSRPNVTINLYASNVGVGETVINSMTVNASNNYKYYFDSYENGKKLPAYTPAGQKIVYRVEEVEIPGYLSEKVEVVAKEDINKLVFDFYNTYGELLIRKVDAVTGATLEGAELAILDASGNEVDRWVSGISAHVVDITKVTMGATYTLREISAPAGYKVAPDQTFVFEKGTTTVVEMRDERIIGSVRLRKLDATTREALDGAEFALYRADGTRVYASGTPGSYTYSERSSNGRFAVNTAGELVISSLPYGSYYFREIAAPTGYVRSDDSFSFSVLEDGAVVEVVALNTKEVGSVRLRKTNADGSVSLAGAVFELYAKTPTTAASAIASTIYSDVYYRVGTYTTDASGVIYVGDLPWDDYYFVEVQAPAGYEVNTDVNGDPIAYTFTIGASGTAVVAYDLGRITNSTTPDTPPTPPTTPRRGGEVRGERRREDAGRRSGGVLSGVLGVRAAPKAGVLGERLGPVTGDAANIFLWTLLLLASLGSIFGVLIANIRRKKKTA